MLPDESRCPDFIACLLKAGAHNGIQKLIGRAGFRHKFSMSIVHGGKLDVGIEFLSKPYSREAIARKIRHVLKNASPMKAAAARQEPDNLPPMT